MKKPPRHHCLYFQVEDRTMWLTVENILGAVRALPAYLANHMTKLAGFPSITFK